MGCQILSDGINSVFYDSTTMTAFGPVMHHEEEAEGFMEFLDIDPRRLSHKELYAAWDDWCRILNERLT